MKEKMQKLLSVIKKDGVFAFIKKAFRYIKTHLLSKINIFNYINFIIDKRKYAKIVEDMLRKSNYDRIIMWRSSFGWNVKLFQRPQHISLNLAKNQCLVLYEVTEMTDTVKSIVKKTDNLYLVNFGNKPFSKYLLGEVNKIDKPKYLQCYSTDWTLSIHNIKYFTSNNYKVLYEYIDDINPVLSGTKEIPKNIVDKYKYAMRNKDVTVVVTADKLKEDVLKKRGSSNLILATNGVDYDFFQYFDDEYEFEKKFTDIINNGKTTIGYYGALASWFDYELIKKINKTNKYNIVLFGIKYDHSYDNSKIGNLKNVHFMGAKDYSVLKNYAKKIDVLTIPFLINDITKATSPVKLFEYMALGKPIVTTNMDECKKYKSVLIAKTHDEFISKIEEAISLMDSKDYIKLLKKEAIANSWGKKAIAIVKGIAKNE